MDVGPLAGLRNNIRESNRAWLVCFVGLIVIGGLLVILTAQQEQLVEVIQPKPPHNEHGLYLDTAHTKFVSQFKDQMSKRGIQDAEFENSGRFRITTSPDTSQDDIVFMSSAAARAILHRFKNAPYVYVYTQNTETSSLPKLVCETRWVARRGDFDTRPPVAPKTQLPTRREP